jgi:uncharacterized membrane protein YcaP (DUF421 family)
LTRNLIAQKFKNFCIVQQTITFEEIINQMDATAPLNFYLIAIRSVLVYLFIIGAIRISGKKELSQLSIIDLVFIMLISSAVQNAMVSDKVEWDEFIFGIVSAASLFILNHIFKVYFFENRSFSKLIKGEPVMLISKGQILKSNMEKEKISMDELQEVAREHGEEDISKVDLAVLETDGSISIISKDYHHQTNRKRKHGKQLPTSSSN